MASSSKSFYDWRETSSQSLMSTAEELLDKLERMAELLSNIDSDGIKNLPTRQARCEQDAIVSQVQDGLESARGLVGMLKREKWRLNRREMSVELKIGELEDYKLHLRSDMSSLNQTVEVLSMRVVQLENELVEAQEVHENLEAELTEHKRSLQETTAKISDYQSENIILRKELKLYSNHSDHTLFTENQLLKNEKCILQDENKRLKELLRQSETKQKEMDATSTQDYISRLTNDFLRELNHIESNTTASDKQ